MSSLDDSESLELAWLPCRRPDA
eukprot:SAG11_NODE_36892_length_259_cov_0.968750_1_plen_22_part_01